MVNIFRKRNFAVVAFLLVLVGASLDPVGAVPISIPFSAVQAADPAVLPDSSAAIEVRLAHVLRVQLEKFGFNVAEGVMLNTMPLDAYSKDLASFCAVPLPRRIETDAAMVHVSVDPSSTVVIDLDNIQSMEVAFDLTGSLHTNADARVEWGQAVPFVGNCEKVGTDSGTIDIALPYSLRFTLGMSVTPSYDSTTVALVLDKSATVTGTAEFGTGSITPKFGGASLTDGVISAFEDYLLNSLRRSGGEKFNAQIERLNLRLDGKSADGQLDDTVTPFNGTTTYSLVSDPGDADLARALLENIGVPERLIDVLYTRGGELLLTLLVANPAERKTVLTDLALELGCDGLISTYGVALPRTPLYRNVGSACTEVSPVDTEIAAYYRDASCTQQVAFTPTTDAQFCADRFSPQSEQTLGNAAAWEADGNQPNDVLPQVPSRPWTTLLSTRLNIGTVPLGQSYQPYVKQLQYKTISQPRANVGECALEMRIYKKDVAGENLRPLLALHGGTWRSRGFSFLGLEASIPHFTEQGFVVFVPFYRLVGASDGNEACNQASWREVTADVEDALSWVREFGGRFGANATPVSVFGQSAGAHLAMWLATNKPESVDRALLFYPPLDVLEFLEGAIPAGGRYEAYRGFGLKALANFFGAKDGGTDVRLDELNLTGIDIVNPPKDLVAAMPDSVFNLNAIDLTAPPVYLARCAAQTSINLDSLDPALPPAALLLCLKQDLSAFIKQNGFISRVNETKPFFVLQGGVDSLVPYEQSIALCNAVDGLARGNDLVGDRVSFNCGAASKARVVSAANHALDLGLCIGDVCPAGAPGTPTRVATEESLVEAYTWLASDIATVARPAPQRERPPTDALLPASSKSTATGGGAIFLDLISAVIACLCLSVARIVKIRNRRFRFVHNVFGSRIVQRLRHLRNF